MKKTYMLVAAASMALLAFFASCGTTKELSDADLFAITDAAISEADRAVQEEESAEARRREEEEKRFLEASLGKIFSMQNQNGDYILNVTLPENATAVNLYRKAEGEQNFQLVYQAWGKNENAGKSKGKKLNIIDYFVDNGKKYTYRANYRLLNDPEQKDYDLKNIGGADSNEVTIVPVNGYGDFRLLNMPEASYEQATSRMTFLTLPKTNMESMLLPEGLEKQPVQFVYVNPELYGLWVYAPETDETPVFITLGKIEGIDAPADPKAAMLDVTLRSDDGDGGWRLSIDKTAESAVDGWTYREFWFRKYTGSSYGLPQTIVIPKAAVQKAEIIPVNDPK